MIPMLKERPFLKQFPEIKTRLCFDMAITGINKSQNNFPEKNRVYQAIY